MYLYNTSLNRKKKEKEKMFGITIKDGRNFEKKLKISYNFCFLKKPYFKSIVS